MEDKKYSLDDILNEYSASSENKSSDKSEWDLDVILGSYDKKEQKSKPKISLHNTDLFNRINKKYDEDPEPDDFTQKYDKLSQKVNTIREKSPKEPYVPEPKPDRSFSEKFEQGVIYGDEKQPEEKPKLRLPKPTAKKAPVQEVPHKPEAPIQSAADTPRIVNNPFEKYSPMDDTDEQAAGETPGQTQAQASQAPSEQSSQMPVELVSRTPAEQSHPVIDKTVGTSTDLDDILNEYAEKKKKTVRSEGTFHKGITDFFTKLVPKQSGNEVSGNTELLDGMMKAKRERISRTQHVAPIERKSITDIDLNLDDKIIPDTAQINMDKEQKELDKINALKERRSKKIKDFVLVGDEEDVEGEETGEDEAAGVIDDFENIADAPSIAHDIAQLKGSLILRLVVLVICFTASAYIAIANDMGNIMELLSKKTQVSTYLFVNAILGLLAGFSSYTVISCGLSKILSLKADCDSLCAVSVVSSIAATMIMFANENLIRGSLVHVYVSVAIASLLFNTMGKLFIVTRTQRSFRFVSGSGDKYAVFPVADEETAQNFTRGALSDFPNLAAMRKTEFLSDFLKTTYSSDSTDRFCQIFTPVVLAAAVVIGIIAGILGQDEHSTSSIYIGISVFVGVVSICTGFSMMLVVNLPMLRSSKKNMENQGVILGYECIDEFAETNSVLIDADQLFPQGSVKLAAIKVFSDTRIDEAIVEAASLTTQAGSILKNMFYDIIAGKTELLNPVESYIFEDSMGLCGWINNKRVLLGNRDLMVNHSIEGMPPIAKEKEYTENGRHAVYLSISGELSAMFLVEITPTMEIGHAMRDLQKNDIYIMIRSVDSLVSINRLSELFDISPEHLKLIPFRIHEQFGEVTAYQMRQRSTLACSGKFSALSSLIISCKRLKTTIGVGIGIQAVSIILGILICLAMVVLNDFRALSVSMALTFNFAFTAVLILFQLLRKN